MSDLKRRRAARESGRADMSPGDALPTETVPIVPPVGPEAIIPGVLVPEAPIVAEVVSAPLEAIAPLAPEAVSAPAEQPTDSVDDSWKAVAETQAALARGVEEIAIEMTGMTRSGIAAAVDAAIGLLAARTFSEAVEINAGLARRGVDAMIEGSARLSGIAVNAVSEASQPMLSRLGGSWSSVRPG